MNNKINLHQSAQAKSLPQTCFFWKMLSNINDCVKKIFLYFTASLILAWISIQIIYTRVCFIAMNTYQSDLKSHQSAFNKNWHVCSFNFMCVVLVLVFIKWISQSETILGSLSNKFSKMELFAKTVTGFCKKLHLRNMSWIRLSHF